MLTGNFGFVHGIAAKSKSIWDRTACHTRFYCDAKRGDFRSEMKLANARGAGKTVCASEVARHVGGQDENVWRPLMEPVRAQVITLAKQGSVLIKQGADFVAQTDLQASTVYPCQIYTARHHVPLKLRHHAA